VARRHLPVRNAHALMWQATHAIALGVETMLSCNYILNFQFSRPEGVRAGWFAGPVAFGETVYNLVNPNSERMGSSAI
jgi:hypothetical protein